MEIFLIPWLLLTYLFILMLTIERDMLINTPCVISLPICKSTEREKQEIFHPHTLIFDCEWRMFWLPPDQMRYGLKCGG